jgi:hypothetical protein
LANSYPPTFSCNISCSIPSAILTRIQQKTLKLKLGITPEQLAFVADMSKLQAAHIVLRTYIALPAVEDVKRVRYLLPQSLTTLTLAGPEAEPTFPLAQLGNLTNLTDLRLGNYDDVQASDLNLLSNLKSFTCFSTTIDWVNCTLPLNSLTVAVNQIAEIAHMTTLTSLTARILGNFADLQSLRDLNSLQYLFITPDHFRMLSVSASSLHILTSLPALKELKVHALAEMHPVNAELERLTVISTLEHRGVKVRWCIDQLEPSDFDVPDSIE